MGGAVNGHSAGPRVLLLGASGFVGSAVLRALAARPGTVVAVSRRGADVPADTVARVEVRAVDATARDVVAGLVADVDVVVVTLAFIAGSSTWRITDGDTEAERVNVGIVRDLVDAVAARGDRGVAVVFAGAASQVGTPEKEPLDGSEPDRPRGEYDHQKLAAERVLLEADRSGVLTATSVRLPTVYGYGPRSTTRDKGVVTLMVRRAMAGEPITMWHDGTVRRDLLHVDDAAAGLVAATDHTAALAGRHWLLGTGKGTELGAAFGEVAGLVADRTGTPPVDVVSVPPPAHAEAGDFRSITVDPSPFRRVTRWSPRIDLTEGLRRTVEFVAAGREEELR